MFTVVLIMITVVLSFIVHLFNGTGAVLRRNMKLIHCSRMHSDATNDRIALPSDVTSDGIRCNQ